MSTLRVNNIVNYNNNGSVLFDKGLSLANNTSITADRTDVTGVCTAAFFSGNASQLTNVTGILPGKVLALNILL